METWPTPNVPNGGRTMSDEDVENKGATDKGKRQVGLENVATRFQWPTPRAEDSEQVGNHRNPNSHPGDSLGATAKLWSTPKTPTGGPETRSSKAKRGAGGEDLDTQARLWATPTTRDSKDTPGQTCEENCLLGRQVLTSVTDGGRSSSDGRKLNPLFDEWLIGWPIGWTCPHRPPGPDASETIGFERWETASIRVLRLWLSAYWRSGLESVGSSDSRKKVS